MAFCTNCGAKLDDNARFCPGCGKPMQALSTPVATLTPTVTAAPAVTASAAPAGSAAAQPSPYMAPVAAAPAQPAKGGSAVKIVLVIAGVFVLLIVMAVAALIYVGYRAKKALNVNMSATEGSAAQVAANLGVEAYPGAKPLKGSGATFSLGGVTVGGAQFETSDPVATVSDFYRAKYPNSTFSSDNQNDQSLVVSSDKGFVTISIAERAGRTRITVSRMAGSPPH
jgi:zinc ribbon protein